MDIRVFNKAGEPLGLVDEMAALVWTIRYFKIGEFQLQAPMTPNNRELLKIGNVVVKHDGYIDLIDDEDTAWRRAMEITYVKYSRDSEGQQLIEATGQSISSWLNLRVIYPQLQYSGTLQEIINFLYDKNGGAGTDDTARKFPANFTVLDQEDFGGSTVSYSNEELTYLGEEIISLTQRGKLGFDILIDEAGKRFGFYLYKGADKTADNTAGNAPCIFSTEYDNVTGQEFEDDVTNYRTVAYVRGAPDSEGYVDIVTVGDTTDTGLARRELAVDASDIQRQAEDDEGQQEDIPEGTYQAMLATKGLTELSSSIESYTFNSNIRTESNLKYKRDFDIGDRITCLEKSWGVTINSRITEIIQTFEAGSATITATFGESSPTLLEKIRKVR